MITEPLTREQHDEYAISEEIASGDQARLVRFDDGREAWYIARADGSYWAMAYNEDEIFATEAECLEWLNQRIG